MSVRATCALRQRVTMQELEEATEHVVGFALAFSEQRLRDGELMPDERAGLEELRLNALMLDGYADGWIEVEDVMALDAGDDE